ncbi:MAG: amidohydrolase, partial [Chloroflexota bacterium]|nr:amidohydrolase [Chloroflexota bacterium]
KNIVYSAQAEDLSTVIIDGETVMRDRDIRTIDIAQVARDLQAGAERMWPNMPKGDWADRTIDQLAPQSLPAFRDDGD